MVLDFDYHHVSYRDHCLMLFICGLYFVNCSIIGASAYMYMEKTIRYLLIPDKFFCFFFRLPKGIHVVNCHTCSRTMYLSLCIYTLVPVYIVRFEGIIKKQYFLEFLLLLVQTSRQSACRTEKRFFIFQ